MASGAGFVHRRLRILVPLRHRDFRLLWTGMTVSLLGDGITTIALAWQTYAISNVATAFSMVMFSMAVPQVILLLIGGAVSDRFERRKVMIFADAIRMVAVFALGMLSLSGHIQVWHMMLIAALYGSGTAFFGPAFDAIVPDLVPAAELTQANALDQFVRPAAFRMIGPALGGLLIAVFGTPGDAFMIDGVTFSISIASLLLIGRHPITREGEEPASSMITEIKEGLGYVRTQTWLWGTFLAATLAYLIFWGPAEVLLPFMVKNELGGSPGELGLILALGGIGAMFAAIVMGNREMPRRHMTFMYVAWTISTLAIAGYGIARLPWQAMFFCFCFNALESAGLIVWITTKQRLVPQRLLGRVSSFDWFISTALVPVSYALTGPIANTLGARPTLVAAGLLGAAVTFAFLFLPGMRSIERSGVLAGVHLESGLEGALEAQAAPIGEPPLEPTYEHQPEPGLGPEPQPVAIAVSEPEPTALAVGASTVDRPATSRADVDAFVAETFAKSATVRAAIGRLHASRPLPRVPARVAGAPANGKGAPKETDLESLRARLEALRDAALEPEEPDPGLEPAEPSRRAG
jgi:MFS family permease